MVSRLGDYSVISYVLSHSFYDALIHEHLAMFFPLLDRISKSCNTIPIRPWTLQEPAITPDRITCPILRGAVELWC